MCQAWFTKSGKRLGSYDLSAAVTCCQPTLKSKYLLTSSADGNATIFEVETGKVVKTYSHKTPTRDCAWAIGEQMFIVVQMGGKALPSQISMWGFDPEGDEDDDEPVRVLSIVGSECKGNFRKARFLDVEGTVLAIHDDGVISKWNSDDEACIASNQIAKLALTDLFLTPDRGLALVTSTDQNAYLVNVETLEVIKTYKSNRPLNAGCISPILNHTLLGGGQDKHQVTLSATDQGHFETQFWHTLYEECLTEVPGHYGPINSLAITRDGTAFISGSEDGNVRLYHFDQGYFKCTY